MKELGRLLTAMVTPFDEEGNVDYPQARSLANRLLDSGSDGVVVVGTTGESPTLVRGEEFRLFAEIKSAIGDRGSVVAGTGSNSTEEAVLVTKEAEQIGVDACLLVVPYYNKPNQEGMYQHFKKIAESTNLPCILYNVPARTVVGLTAETVSRLSQIDNIVGVKEASGSLSQVVEILNSAREGFLVWSGNDEDTFPVLAVGGYGVISVASHLVGPQIKDMITQFIGGDTKGAAFIHRRLLDLFKTLFIVSNPTPVKYALNAIGIPVGKPRLPLVEPDEETRRKIINMLIRYGLLELNFKDSKR